MRYVEELAVQEALETGESATRDDSLYVVLEKRSEEGEQASRGLCLDVWIADSQRNDLRSIGRIRFHYRVAPQGNGAAEIIASAEVAQDRAEIA